MESARVLVAEDDRSVRDALVLALELEGYTVDAQPDGERALQAFDQFGPDVLILDVMMPTVDGLTVCRRLRARNVTTPILVLTARDQVSDRVTGLDAGADDYVVKPFSPRELTARVRAVLRRAVAIGVPDGLGVEALDTGRLHIDLPAREVTIAGALVPLTAREFDLLVHLARSPRRAFTREELLERVWGYSFGDTATVTVHVRRLREKVEANPSEPDHLVTVWGVGYRWDP